MIQKKHIKIADYSQEFIKQAIASYINSQENNRSRGKKYYSIEENKKKSQFRAKVYYWTKKKKAYHPEYNPTGKRLMTAQTLTN